MEAALALLDPDQHPTAVDSASRQACDLAALLESCSRPGHYLIQLADGGPPQ